MERTETTRTSAMAPPPPLPHDRDGANGHEEIDLNVAKPHALWVVAACILAVAGLLALLITGLIPRRSNTEQLTRDSDEQKNAPVMVNVVTPHRGPAEVSVNLPGTLRPWQEVSIFARTTGYLKKYYVDISSDVEAGQLMAEIDTPELNQELAQADAALLLARAAVTRATADMDLAKTTYTRFSGLKETQGITMQMLDEKKSAVDAAAATLESGKASVAAAEANVRRLKELQSFEKVSAPFSGVVTGRAYDVGSLILANPTATDVKPMFKIAENDVVRAFVNVPQSSALQIKKGMEVKVTVRERPRRVFTGTVMGTTNYLDPTNRSLLTEVKVKNSKEPDGAFALLPGMYVQTSFTIQRDTPPLTIPGPALISNSSGTQVAVVSDGKAHFKKITLGQDFGSEVEVVEGLDGDEQIIANPGERVVEGAAVRTGS